MGYKANKARKAFDDLAATMETVTPENHEKLAAAFDEVEKAERAERCDGASFWDEKR